MTARRRSGCASVSGTGRRTDCQYLEHQNTENMCLDDASGNDSWNNIDLSVMIELIARPGHAHCIEQLCRQGSSR